MSTTNKLMLAFYGDDFTGSTDALEFLSRAGIKTALFIEPPTTEQLAQYENLGAIGVAGMSRAMSPDEMEQELRPAFTALKALGAPHVHYKICSTFDSSPQIGSIGKAIDVGAEVFGAAFIPLLVAAPPLGRYCAFGNLFARMGIGSKGQIHRLDRHPSMSKHPVTPADESDLRLHLSKQTTKKTVLVDILTVNQPYEEAKAVIKDHLSEGEVVLFDALYEDQLAGIGRLIDDYADGKQLFSVGSSGIEMALGAHWKEQGKLPAQQKWVALEKAVPLLVISGSCSPVTSAQISYALNKGFAEIRLNTAEIAEDNGVNLEKYASAAIKILNAGQSLIIHTSTGNDDARISEANQVFAAKGLTEQQIRKQTSKVFGTALGAIAKEVIAQTGVKRVVIAGGDTSGYAARAMGIEAVEMIAPLSPGAPMCKAHAPGSPADGIEVNFKGGQVGADNYFELALNGTKYKST